MLQSIERYMKQAIVDKVHSVSSAALASSLVSTNRRIISLKQTYMQAKVSCKNIYYCKKFYVVIYYVQYD